MKDDDQTGVDRQERICREMAARLGLRVDPAHVFIDNHRSAWRRNRKRPGWDQMLAEIRAGKVRHVLCYHPDRLMRQPWDLEELLGLADVHRLMLHGQANRRDLSNSDDRYMLRIEVAHACKSSDDTSRRVKLAQEEAAAAGRAHGGRRTYGYSQGAVLIEHEAEIVREVFRAYLNGKALGAIADDLNARGVPSATGLAWHPTRVRGLIDSPFHAGLRVFRGEIQRDPTTGDYLKGTWTPCVSVGQWTEAQRLRQAQSRKFYDERRPARVYLLRGLVMCGTCGRSMTGSVSDGYATYRCVQRTGSRPEACRRRICADRLEIYAQDVAVELLTKLSVDELARAAGGPDASAAQARRDADQAEIAEDEQRLAELKAEWIAKEITTAEYKEMSAPVKARLAKAQRATVVRPLTALEGITTGPGAAAAWQDLSIERKAAVLRFLFAAIRINTGRPGRGFDYDRIDIEQNPL